MVSPQQIGPYRLLERIGVGAVSNIYRAVDTRSGSVVAVKDVIASAREEAKYLRHVRNEYEVLSQLWRDVAANNGHPGFVRVYALLRSDSILRRVRRRTLVMEYLPGKDLRAENRYPLGQLAYVFHQVALVLVRLHARRIVHGDLKPENVMVSPGGRVTLVDFGFSCPAGSRAESVRGTREYMAPEQVNRGTISELTDIYNFGATMYHLLTSQHLPALLAAPGQEDLFISGENVRPRDVREINPNVPPALARVVMDCCEQEPIKRCSSAKVVADRLAEALRDFR